MSAERYLVVGLGISGAAIARALHERGHVVVVVEDRPSDATRERAASLPGAVDVVEAPGERLRALVGDADVVVPSPGVPASHEVFALASAARTAVRGDVELASQWTDAPVVAVTGTNGKTTVTSLVESMLRASGVHAVAAGNIGVPLVEAVTREAVGGGADVLVVEVSSFQLALTERFRPRVAVWLNLADDHLDAHGSFDAYAAAKARIWANQRDDDLAVVNAEDPAVLGAAARAPARVETFAVGGGADWHVAGGRLVGPRGEGLPAVADLDRALPHDVANALAAAAAATAVGATGAGVAEALRAFRTLPHRVTLVGEAGGVRFYDDSKATNPHAVLAAARGFESVVLVAGGLNKGLDLGVLRAAAPPVHAVVAIGAAADEVVAAFDGAVPVRRARDMDSAVAQAAALAVPGDAVLLSPGCASFDRYRGYAERGDDFARAVRELVAAAEAGP